MSQTVRSPWTKAEIFQIWTNLGYLFMCDRTLKTRTVFANREQLVIYKTGFLQEGFIAALRFLSMGEKILLSSLLSEFCSPNILLAPGHVSILASYFPFPILQWSGFVIYLSSLLWCLIYFGYGYRKGRTKEMPMLWSLIWMDIRLNKYHANDHSFD